MNDYTGKRNPLSLEQKKDKPILFADDPVMEQARDHIC